MLLRVEEVVIGSLGPGSVNFAFDSGLVLKQMLPAGIPRLMQRHDDELYDDARGFWITQLFSPYFSLWENAAGLQKWGIAPSDAAGRRASHKRLLFDKIQTLLLLLHTKARRHARTHTCMHMHYHTRSLCFRACVRQGCLYNKRKFAVDWLQQSLTLHTGLHCLLFRFVFILCWNGSDHKMNYKMIR